FLFKLNRPMILHRQLTFRRETYMTFPQISYVFLSDFAGIVAATASWSETTRTSRWGNGKLIPAPITASYTATVKSLCTCTELVYSVHARNSKLIELSP